MSIDTAKVAILVDNYFEQDEFEKPLQQLKQTGAAVTVVSAKDKNLRAMQHAEQGDAFLADLLITDAKPEDYDALVLPGGVMNADKLRMDQTARDWAKHFDDNGKLIAAICHAPWLLVSTDLVEGRRLTSYYTLQDDIRNAGGEWVDQPLIQDGHFITSRKPDDIPVFVTAIIRWFDKL